MSKGVKILLLGYTGVSAYIFYKRIQGVTPGQPASFYAKLAVNSLAWPVEIFGLNGG